MAGSAEQTTSSRSLSTTDAEAIRYLKQAIADGKHWYIALLEAMGLWGSAEEVCNGRVYRYLIAGEAFDWLLLAERLCGAVDVCCLMKNRMPLFSMANRRSTLTLME